MQFSLFGSILTFGAMIGAITSGPIGDLLGRKGVSIQDYKPSLRSLDYLVESVPFKTSIDLLHLFFSLSETVFLFSF